MKISEMKAGDRFGKLPGGRGWPSSDDHFVVLNTKGGRYRTGQVINLRTGNIFDIVSDWDVQPLDEKFEPIAKGVSHLELSAGQKFRFVHRDAPATKHEGRTYKKVALHDDFVDAINAARSEPVRGFFLSDDNCVYTFANGDRVEVIDE